jgi:predicted N-formylglutamate amidohydrolase
MPTVLILTCEHASNRIPKRWAGAFRGKERILETHRGYDLGANAVASALARLYGAPLLSGTASRLLVDLNRSPHSPQLFSEFTRGLPEEERSLILRDFYLPHRAAVEQAVALSRARGVTVLHVGVHSFTPVLNGVRRNADIGLLFDPRRARERALCRSWKAAIQAEEPALRVRLNYPYRGTSDGFTTALRRTHGGDGYLGIEVELLNTLVRTTDDARRVAQTLGAALRQALRPPAHAH